MLLKAFKVGAEFHITPHLTLDAGYKTASHHLSGPYATLKYTIGTSKFAWRVVNIVKVRLQQLALRCLIRYIAVIWLY